MTVQDLVEKLRRYPVPSVCGLIVLVCFLAYYLRMDLLTDLEIENGDVQHQLQQVDQNLSHGRTLAADIAAMNRYKDELDGRLIKSGELATNLKYFYELEATTHVAIADLRQTAGSPAKGGSKPTVVPVGYSLLMSGDFQQLVSYINELEHGRHFYRLQSVAVQRVDRSGGEPGSVPPLSMALNLDLLGQP